MFYKISSELLEPKRLEPKRPAPKRPGPKRRVPLPTTTLNSQHP